MSDDGVHYKKGSFIKLLKYLETTVDHKLSPEKKCILIADENWGENAGYDGTDTLQLIIEDIEEQGFQVKVDTF